MKTFNLFFLIAAAVFAVGCASKSADQNASDGSNKAPAQSSSAAAPSPSGETAAAKSDDSAGGKSDSIETVYTDLSAAKCKTIESNEEEQWIVQECPGTGGYKLEVSEGDLRQSIAVISPSGKRSELNFGANVSSGFSSLGEKAEWRVKKVDGKPSPFALITRFNVSEDSENAEKTTSYLIVTKIAGDKSCITEVIKPIPNANEKARESADRSASKPCLEP